MRRLMRPVIRKCDVAAKRHPLSRVTNWSIQKFQKSFLRAHQALLSTRSACIAINNGVTSLHDGTRSSLEVHYEVLLVRKAF
jgi:hypothetical protein